MGILSHVQEWTAGWPTVLTTLWWNSEEDASVTLPALGPQVRSRRQADVKQAVAAIEHSLPPVSGREARIARTAMRAGVLLWHDLLDESHTEAQSVEGEGAGRLGDYWHAIMHRREPDYGNARYWFRRVGAHVVHEELQRRLLPLKPELLQLAGETAEGKVWLDRIVGTRWNAEAMVSLCETCARRPEGDSLVQLGECLQAAEMTLLMDESLRSA